MTTDPTDKPLDYPDIEDADAKGMTLADLDPTSDIPPPSHCEEEPQSQGPAEGPDIG